MSNDNGVPPEIQRRLDKTRQQREDRNRRDVERATRDEIRAEEKRIRRGGRP